MKHSDQHAGWIKVTGGKTAYFDVNSPSLKQCFVPYICQKKAEINKVLMYSEVLDLKICLWRILDIFQVNSSRQIQNFIVYPYAQLEDESTDMFGRPVHLKQR